MDENKLLHRIQFLAHHIFITTAEGKEFLKLMKVLHLNTPTFPQQPNMIEAHGGATGWAAFREGQLTLLRSLEQLAQNYLQKIASENQAQESVK
jgi:hypothetical protein